MAQTTIAGSFITENTIGAAKAWAVVAANGTLESPSFNMTSVSRSATGRYVYTFDTDFSDADYTGSPGFRTGYGSAALQEGTQAEGSVALRFWDACGTLIDVNHSCVFHGEQ